MLAIIYFYAINYYRLSKKNLNCQRGCCNTLTNSRLLFNNNAIFIKINNTLADPEAGDRVQTTHPSGKSQVAIGYLRNTSKEPPSRSHCTWT